MRTLKLYDMRDQDNMSSTYLFKGFKATFCPSLLQV